MTGLGQRIREVRERAELNQKEFCAVLGIPQSTLSAYETGRMQPTISSLVNIAEKFNISLDWLCGIESTNNKSGLPDDLIAALTEAEKYLQELEIQRRNDSDKIKALREDLTTARIKERGGK